MTSRDDHIIGYVDDWTVKPGGKVVCHVSTSATSFDADVVELRGWRMPPPETQPLAAVQPLTVAGQHQRIACGSFGVGDLPPFQRTDCWTFSLWIKPTHGPNDGEQGILSFMTSKGDRRFAVLRQADGTVCLSNAEKTTSSLPIAANQWSHLVGHVAAEGIELIVRRNDVKIGSIALPLSDDLRDATLICLAAAMLEPLEGRRIPWRPGGCFSGRIADVRLLEGHIDPNEIAGYARKGGPEHHGERLLLHWAPGVSPRTDRVEDVSGGGHDLSLYNGAMRGVPGPLWDGTYQRRSDGPEHYDAIHFNPDAVDDANWEPSLTFDIPETLPSGVYAVRITTADAMTDVAPFFVVPGDVEATARTALVMSTFTYLAYGNQHVTDEPRHRAGLVSPSDLMAGGLSAYDCYADGTGVRFSSRRRPLRNVRPEFVNPGADDGFRNFIGDLMVMSWLKQENRPFDVLTDDLLHAEADDAFGRYDVVICGSHPEYWTLPMMKGLKRFLSNGGRMLYLGGNGFYWKTVVDPADPARVEISRANAGTRLWESEPGEAHFLTTDELGGLWRYLGYSPHELVGTGFSGMGWAPGSGYRLAEVAHEWGWVTDGVPEDFGWSGEILGTAAADEVDSMNPEFGTPDDTVLIASASMPLETYVSTPEDFPVMPLVLPAIRGDVVIRPYPNGGAVFAAGSIAWPGALAADPDGVGRMTGNVLDRFLEVPRGSDLRRF